MKKKKKMTKKLKRTLLRLLALLCAFGVFLMGIFVASAVRDYKGKPGVYTMEVNIPAGTPTKRIAKILHNRGVLKHPHVFLYYCRSKGYNTQFMAGVHTFYRNMGYEEITGELMQVGRDWDVCKVTVIEGMTLTQIADKLETYNVVSAIEFLAAADQFVPSYDYIPTGENRIHRLEGYLFPATYSLKRDMTAEQIIEIMLERFNQIVTPELLNVAAQRNMTLDDVITLASVIQAEAATDSEMPLVSSVFHNRLHSDRPYLESCATVQYLLPERKAILSEEDTKIESPYNTYQNPGLPAGPIGAPGSAAITAAVYPQESNYYYFLAGKDGKTVFSETYDEHLQAQRDNF